MAQTASGYLRIAALLIATAAFATIWTGDQQTQKQFAIARKAAGGANHDVLLSQDHAASSPTFTRTTLRPPRHARLTSAGNRRSIDAAHSAADATYMARVEVEMPLPIGIAPGRYQVVDQSGAVQTIRIASSNGPAERQDVYVLDQADGSRRFFIRLIETVAEPHESRPR